MTTTEPDLPRLIDLLIEMGKEHAERDADGERDGTWWNMADDLEDAAGVPRGTFPREVADDYFEGGGNE